MKKKELSLIMLLIITALLNAGSISGMISAEETEQFFSDLFLTRLPQQQPFLIISALSNEAYILDNLPVGDYTLQIVPNSPGYPPQYYPGVPSPEEAEILVIEDNQTNLVDIDFYLEEIEPEELGYISGSVFEENAQPVSGLEIYLYGIFANYWNTYMVETDNDGNFEIPEIFPGPYILFVEHVPGYQHYFWENAHNFQEADPIFIEPGSQITDINIQLEPAENYNISGRVEELTGGLNFPLEGALVSGYSQNCWGEGEYFQVLTDEYGNYNASISNGRYWIFSTKAEYTEQFWQNASTFPEATPLHVNQDTEDIDFVLEPLSDPDDNSISGHITLDGEEPGYSCMVIVIASDEDDDWTDTTLSESSGYYYIDEIPAGDYYVVMLTSTTPPVYYPEGYDWENAEIVNIEGNVTNVDFAIDEFSQNGVFLVEGFVEEPGRNPITGVSVIFFDENEMPFSYGISNDSGYYSAAALETGSYTAIASKVYYNTEITDISLADNIELDFVITHATTSSDESEIVQAADPIKIYPNPVNPGMNRSGTTISFTPDAPGVYRVSVFNLRGQLVKNIYSGWISDRENVFSWDGTSYNGESATGIYMIAVSHNNEIVKSGKVLILK